MTEEERTYNLKIDISMYHKDGTFYPASLLKLSMNMIEEHLDALGMGEKSLMARLGIGWVILCNTVTLKRPLMPEDELTGRTWHSGGRLPLFRRDYEISDASGAKIACGATFSTLVDVSTHRICTDRDKLAEVSLPSGPTTVEADRLFRFPEGNGFTSSEEFTVRPSMLDGLGHVNNTRYGEFVWDAMTEEERRGFSLFSCISVWYLSELNAGDSVRIDKAVLPDGTLVFRGVSGEKTAFGMKFSARI